MSAANELLIKHAESAVNNAADNLARMEAAAKAHARTGRSLDVEYGQSGLSYNQLLADLRESHECAMAALELAQAMAPPDLHAGVEEVLSEASMRAIRINNYLVMLSQKRDYITTASALKLVERIKEIEDFLSRVLE